MDPELRISVGILGPGDGRALDRVADGVFDGPVDPRWRDEFLADPRHHLAVAVDAGRVVGFASAVHYVHPDKPPELWVNEVGVADSHRRRGLARRLVEALLERGRILGCRTAWVLTEHDNGPARALYSATGGKEDESPVLYEFDLTAEGG